MLTEEVDGIREGQLLELHNEVDRIEVFATGKATSEVVAGVDGTVKFVTVGAQKTHVALDIFARMIEDIGEQVGKQNLVTNLVEFLGRKVLAHRMLLILALTDGSGKDIESNFVDSVGSGL